MCKNIIFIFKHESNMCFVWKIFFFENFLCLFMKSEKLGRYEIVSLN